MKGPFKVTFNPEMCMQQRHGAIHVTGEGYWPTPVGFFIDRPLALMAVNKHVRKAITEQAILCGYSPIALELDSHPIYSLVDSKSYTQSVMQRMADPQNPMYKSYKNRSAA
jgi:hypothetical protein